MGSITILWLLILMMQSWCSLRTNLGNKFLKPSKCPKIQVFDTVEILFQTNTLGGSPDYKEKFRIVYFRVCLTSKADFTRPQTSVLSLDTNCTSQLQTRFHHTELIQTIGWFDYTNSTFLHIFIVAGPVEYLAALGCYNVGGQ